MNERSAERGLALLDATCVRGALTACDSAQLLAELCARNPAGEVCAVLRSQGRVPRREQGSVSSSDGNGLLSRADRVTTCG